MKRGPKPRTPEQASAKAAERLENLRLQRSGDVAESFAEKPLRAISTKRICNILKPFMHDREMLVAIRDTCDRLIRELHGVEAGAPEAVAP